MIIEANLESWHSPDILLESIPGAVCVSIVGDAVRITIDDDSTMTRSGALDIAESKTAPIIVSAKIDWKAEYAVAKTDSERLAIIAQKIGLA
jgi:hypothetical protein